MGCFILASKNRAQCAKQRRHVSFALCIYLLCGCEALLPEVAKVIYLVPTPFLQKCIYICRSTAVRGLKVLAAAKTKGGQK